MPPIQVIEEKKTKGPLIAVAIILALLIVGGLYFLKERASQPVYNPQKDIITESLNTQSNSDDLSSIEADLNSTNIDNIDQGAAAIDAELQ